MLDCYGSLPKIAAKIKTRSWFQNEMGGPLHFAPSGLSFQFPYIVGAGRLASTDCVNYVLRVYLYMYIRRGFIKLVITFFFLLKVSLN